MKEGNISLNPHEDRIIGIIGNDIYFKSKHNDYIITTDRNEYFRILNLYLDCKKDYCERYDHFCGVFGDLFPKEYIRDKNDFILNEMIEIEDDGKNDGIDFIQKPYPLYHVFIFEDHVDMEHG